MQPVLNRAFTILASLKELSCGPSFYTISQQVTIRKPRNTIPALTQLNQMGEYLSCRVMKIESSSLDSFPQIGPSAADSCVATVINCFPGVYGSSFIAELLKILLISQSPGSVWAQLERRSWYAFLLYPAVISSSVFCHGFLFHRLVEIFHSHPSLFDERCVRCLKVLLWNKKRGSFSWCLGKLMLLLL